MTAAEQMEKENRQKAIKYRFLLRNYSNMTNEQIDRYLNTSKNINQEKQISSIGFGH